MGRVLANSRARTKTVIARPGGVAAALAAKGATVTVQRSTAARKRHGATFDCSQVLLGGELAGLRRRVLELR